MPQRAYIDEIIPSAHDTDPFQAKIGGQPILPGKKPPQWDAMQQKCARCKEPQTLVAQLYAPLDKSAFDRWIFLFACDDAKCCLNDDGWKSVIVARSDGNDEDEKKPLLFGTTSSPFDFKHSANEWSFNGNNCTTKSSLLDLLKAKEERFEEGESLVASISDEAALTESFQNVSISNDCFDAFKAGSFQGYYLTTVEQEDKVEKSYQPTRHELDLIRDYERREGSIKNLEFCADEKYENNHSKLLPKHFKKFHEYIANDPEQIIRWDHAGTPILYKALPEKKLQCSLCGTMMVYEFQLMPGLLTYIKEDRVKKMDWVTVLVYSCGARDLCFKKNKRKNGWVVQDAHVFVQID